MNCPAPRAPFAALPLLPVLLPVLLGASGCAPFGSTVSPALLERVADGAYDVGIRYPFKHTRYVMIVEEDEVTRSLTNHPAPAGPDAGTAGVAMREPAAPQRNDRVLAPCAEAAGNWYRHTPAGYVCAGGSAAPEAGG